MVIAYQTPDMPANKERVLKGAPVWMNMSGLAGLSFNGVDNIVVMPTRLKSHAVPFSFAFWVNPATEQVEYADILGNHLAFSGLVMQQDRSTTNLVYFGYGEGAKGYGPGAVQLTAGTWGAFAPHLGLTFRLGQGYGENPSSAAC